MHEAFICDPIRTPIGRHGGGLSGVRTDDLYDTMLGWRFVNRKLEEQYGIDGLAALRPIVRKDGTITAGINDDAEHVNPNGGAIAPGHPLGMSGARLVTTAACQLRRTRGRYALCTMCIGVGQGIAMIIERV